MNVVDLVVIVLILLSAILGFSNGLVREVLGVGAWIGAALIAFSYFHLVQPLAHRLVTNQSLADPVGFGALFLTALVILWVVARLLSRFVRGSMLSGLDRVLGIFFGVARGVALIIIAYIVGGSLVTIDRWPPEVRNARTLPYIYRGAVWAIRIEPPGWTRPQLQVPPDANSPGLAASNTTSPGGAPPGAV